MTGPRTPARRARRSGVVALGVAAAALLTFSALAADPGGAGPRADLGGKGQGRLGSIRIDRSRGSFTVPGVVLRVEPPLEYLAVTKGGMKAYEALLELETDAKTFNLACILLGLDAKKGKASEFHFDPNPIQGDPVRLWVSWRKGDKEVKVPMGECLKVQGMARVPEDWVYTGSTFTTDGRYLAEESGVLVGFVHDPASVIEHRTGLGLGNYGAVGGDASACPPVGAAVRVTVERGAPGKTPSHRRDEGKKK